MVTTDIKTVVLIDDDSTFNFINKSILQSLSFARNIIAYETPDKAMQGLKEMATLDRDDFPGMIFLDINMPDKDGWDFLDEYKLLPEDLRESCRVIMLTSSINYHDIEHARSYDVIDDFVSKPLTADKLTQLLDGISAIE